MSHMQLLRVEVNLLCIEYTVITDFSVL